MMVTHSKKAVNCTLVGDGMVGKTSIARVFIGTRVEEEYVATVFENYAGSASVAGDSYTISIYDPAGQHDYANMRAFTYTDCEVILMCYNASDRESFESIKSFWIPEVRKFRGKKSPIFLVATQTDTRSSCADNPVTSTEGEQLAKEINAENYVETTIKDTEGIKEVFDKVALTALKNRKKKSKIFQRIFGRYVSP